MLGAANYAWQAIRGTLLLRIWVNTIKWRRLPFD